MKHFFVFILIGSFIASIPVVAKEKLALKDLYFGEALFYAYQDNYFDAISRLDTELAQYYGLDEPNLNSLNYHIDHAEFSVGDFELYYRMHDRAGRAIKAVIEGNVEDSIRNEAIFRLAKIYYQKQQPINALHTIKKISGEIPTSLIHEIPFLRAQIYISNGKFSEAINALKTIESANSVLGFAGYNLAVAQLLSGDEKVGVLQLDKVGKIVSSNNKVSAMRDKANLVLGYRLLEAKQAALAKQYLDRVRVSGPFSNQALLGSGWAAAELGKYDRALVPWTILAKRNVTNKSVQEVLLGVPYAYGKLDIHGKAAILYGKALESFSQEVGRLDASIKSIRQGKFLEAIVKEDLKKDKHWLIRLRELPNAPETQYLMQMMASHDFQESLKNYFDLEQLRKKMQHWSHDLDAYEETVRIRNAYYEPLLPEIELKFRALDSKMKLRIEQRNKLDKRLNKMLISARPEFLATAKERILLDSINQVEHQLKKNNNLSNKDSYRIARLRGVINWNIKTQYQDRFSKAHKNLRQLDKHVDKLRNIYQSFVRTRQAATQSYKGYDKPIQRLRIKIHHAQEKIDILMSRQGHLIEIMAITELELRQKRLEQYQVKARFAMAESYDRATKKQLQKKLEDHDK